VSVAADVAALTSAFPALLRWTVELCLAVLLLVTAVNLRGVVAGGKLFALPALLFVGSLVVLIVVGIVRGGPLAPLPAPDVVITPQTVGVLLILAAFANGCAALTGVEAIANATPSFRSPRRARARRAEAGLGIVLGALSIGLAVLIQLFGAGPVEVARCWPRAPSGRARSTCWCSSRRWFCWDSPRTPPTGPAGTRGTAHR
jgi:amino acid transporter